MATKINTLNVNGRLVSWGHSRLEFDGDMFDGLTSVAWDESSEVVVGYAMTKDHAPVGYSAPKYVPGEMKIKGPVHAIAELRAWWKARAIDGKSYGTVIVPTAMLQWDLGAGAPEQTVEWRDLTWTGNSNDNSESADPREEEITIKFLRCLRNDGTLYDSSAETA
jgi:hypothetical protein